MAGSKNHIGDPPKASAQAEASGSAEAAPSASGIKCCMQKSLINNNGEFVCVFCGQVSHYEMVNDRFIDFHKSPYQVSRKSKYQKKYHINNVFKINYFKTTLILQQRRCLNSLEFLRG